MSKTKAHIKQELLKRLAHLEGLIVSSHLTNEELDYILVELPYYPELDRKLADSLEKKRD